MIKRYNLRWCKYVLAAAFCLCLLSSCWAGSSESSGSAVSTADLSAPDDLSGPRSVSMSSGSRTAKPLRSRAAKENYKKTIKPLNDFEVGKYQYCGSDRDCVAAINGCCNCVNGGVEVAVNKERLEAFRNRFDCLKAKCGKKIPRPPCRDWACLLCRAQVPICR